MSMRCGSCFHMNTNTDANKSERLSHLTTEAAIPAGPVILIICHITTERAQDDDQTDDTSEGNHSET